MNPLYRQMPFNLTPEQIHDVVQTEVDTLEEAITLYNLNSGSFDVGILLWDGPRNGYVVYASTYDNIPIPVNPTE